MLSPARSIAHAKPLHHDLDVVVEHRRILPPGEHLLGPKALMLDAPADGGAIWLALSLGDSLINRSKPKDLTTQHRAETSRLSPQQLA